METLERTVLNIPLWKFFYALEVLVLDWGVCDGEAKCLPRTTLLRVIENGSSQLCRGGSLKSR